MPVTIKKKANSAKNQSETRIEGAAQKTVAFLSAYEKTLKPAAAVFAAAALIVAAAIACAGVRRKNRQAKASENCRFSHQAVPGLRSVARASMPPASARSITPAKKKLARPSIQAPAFCG